MSFGQFGLGSTAAQGLQGDYRPYKTQIKYRNMSTEEDADSS